MRPVRWVDVDDNCAVTTVESVDEGAGPYAELAIEGVLGFGTLAEFDAWAAAVRAAVAQATETVEESIQAVGAEYDAVLRRLADDGEQERREQRLELAEKFAREVATWSSKKLRDTYAQPDAVRRAEGGEADGPALAKKLDTTANAVRVARSKARKTIAKELGKLRHDLGGAA